MVCGQCPPYGTKTGYFIGHLSAANDRQRVTQSSYYRTDKEAPEYYSILKDYYQTYVMTNTLPQLQDSAATWTKLEDDLNKLVKQQNEEIYIIAGRDGEITKLPDPINFNDVSVPANFWKVVLILDRPGQGLSDVNTNTLAFAVRMPNTLDTLIDPNKKDANGKIDTTEGNVKKWNNLTNGYVLSIRNLEQITGYDFLSNLPRDLQDAIESKTDLGSLGLSSSLQHFRLL